MLFKTPKISSANVTAWVSFSFLILASCVPYAPSSKSSPSKEDPAVTTPKKDPPVTTPKDPNEAMVFIPGGTFTMGREQFSGTPSISVNVASFYLDQTEVTVKDYEACVKNKKCDLPNMGSSQDSYCLWDDKTTAATKGKERHPMNCVTFGEAKGYCTNQGKRLPTEMEWEYAAIGTTGDLFPWGKSGPIVIGSPAKTCYKATDMLGTCEVKKFPPTLFGNQIPLSVPGLYDMAGNVAEWVDTKYQNMLTTVNIPCDNTDPACVTRGGSWDSLTAFFLNSQFRTALSAQGSNPTTGFRCAKTP